MAGFQEGPEKSLQLWAVPESGGAPRSLGVLPPQLVPHLVVAGLLVALTPLYLRFAMGVRSGAQLAVSCVSMLIWIYALQQGPVRFLAPPWYEPWYGSVALAIWTLVPPMFLYHGQQAQATAP